MKEFDVAIIGSGPGGYVSAIRCAQLGMKTALIEKYSTLGGTCLNVGCIPSKAWLDSSERFYNTVHTHGDHGIKVPDVKLDQKKMSQRVQQVVAQTCEGINFLMKKNKVSVLNGHASFVDTHTLEISGQEKIKAKNIIIATGSKPASLPFIKIDKERIITSTEALKLSKLPKHMIVIGGGVIGVEMSSVFKRLGAKVSIIEYAPSIIATMDQDCGKELTKVLKHEGIEIFASHAVESVERSGQKVKIKAKDLKADKVVDFEGDYCLVAVGRKAYTDQLGLENIQIQTNDRGQIPVNDQLQTQHPHIYAIGDVIHGPMLAHKAEEEGVYVAELLAGQKPHINHHLIPGVVYTWPEVAAVGYTEQELKEKKISYKKGSFPFKASGRARASNENFGFIKVLAHSETDEILGVHMVGPRAADMIMEAVLAMEFKASAEDVARICHAHPTYSESLKEACLAATENRALHI